MVDQSNYWRVPAQVSSCGGTLAEMVQMGWFFPMQQNHVLAGKVGQIRFFPFLFTCQDCFSITRHFVFLNFFPMLGKEFKKGI